MGEVYKARDTRLNRFVAIKTSKEQFSERFEREAHAVAGLNHPNICTLYDVGPNYLVMEYVEGNPVAPTGDVRRLLEIAVQIADALQAAHAAEIVHRDLKPANILLTREGKVKVLDFGLAKRFAAGATEADATATIALTKEHTVVGTVAYMSPEQARGRTDLDGRSDQFSFGVVLYELASGQQPFHGNSVSETMTAIIREEPNALPSSVLPPVRWTIERCLAKEPAERYDSTGDLFRELRQIREGLPEIVSMRALPSPPHPSRPSALLWVVPALLAGFVAAAIWPVPPSGPGRATPVATDAAIETMPAWSPAGDRIAYSADVDGIFQIFTKKIGSSTTTQMTRQKESCYHPFWSADGKRLYFIISPPGGRSSLWSVSLAGGQPEKQLDDVSRACLAPNGRAMALLLGDASGLYRLALAIPPTAPPRPYDRPPVSLLRAIAVGTSMQFTSDGTHLGLYTNASGKAAFWKIPVDGGPPSEMLQGRDTAASLPGPFTWLTGHDSMISGHLGLGFGRLELWDFRRGTMRPFTTGVAHDEFPALSPDGHKLAYVSAESGYNVVQVPLDGSPPRPLIEAAHVAVSPSWSPDGAHFAYVTDRSGVDELWLRGLDGSERLVATQRDFGGGASQLLDSVISPDGTRVAYRRGGSGSMEIWISPVSGEAPVQLWEDPARAPQRWPTWSPDGNWIAYFSTRDGKNAVLKARVGSRERPVLVANFDITQPLCWSPAGDWIAMTQASSELHLVKPDGSLDRVVSHRRWLTYGWSKDGAALYGIAPAGGQLNGRLVLMRMDVPSGRETKIADLGPAPAAFEFSTAYGSLPYRGFSVHPNGKSFLTSVHRLKSDIWLLEDFDRSSRLLDWLRPQL